MLVKFWSNSRFILAATALAIALLASILILPNDASSATAIRINTGGGSQTVDGVKWMGCWSTDNCGGYVKGGNAWSENPASIAGIVSPNSKYIQSSEWTGGETTGVAQGQTAFTFSIPVSSGNYDVKLHFTELNKTAIGQRVFDVRINEQTVLPEFDVFKEAGGQLKAITRTFNVAAVNGKVEIAFIRQVQNAKVNAIEVLSTGTSSSTTSTTTSTTSSTTVPPSSGKLAWSSIASSPTKTLEAAGGAIGNKLYYFGGYNSSYLPVSTAYAYSPSSNSWERLADMPKALTHMGQAIDGNSFIFAGGYGASGGKQVFATSNVYRYDTSAKTWSTLPNLPEARGSGGLALVGRTLHFVGGVNTSRQEKGTHWTLDLSNTSAGWKAAPEFSHPRTHFAMVTMGSNIYTVGGLNGVDKNSVELGEVYKYDTVAKAWSATKETSLPVPLSHITANTFIYNNKMWVITGETKFAVGTNRVWTYDFASKTWAEQTPASAARHAAVAGFVNGSLYLALGDMYTAAAYKASFS